MKRRAVAMLLFICTILLFSCSREPVEMDELMIHELRGLYKKSSAILAATCTEYAESNSYYVLKSDSMLYGSADEIIYCKNDKQRIEKGKKYLLFLHGADSTGKTRFDSDSYTTMEMKNGAVYWNKKRYSRIDVEQQLKSYNSVVYMPAYTRFYSKRDELYEESSIIIIGKPQEASVRNERSVYSSVGAASVENVLTCVETKIRVVGSLRGDYKNGDIIDMVYMPELLSSMTDTVTLSTISMTESDMPDLSVGRYYLFFLKKGTDAKQNYYMPVNPIQGWMEVENDVFKTAEKNVLFTDCKQLNLLAPEIVIANKNKTGKS